MRTLARETVFKLIFASQFSAVEDGFVNALFKADKLDKNDIEYCKDIFQIVKIHGNEFSRLIDGKSILFPESRLFPADRSILFVALAEIFYRKDIPNAVSLNEAANVASKYSTEKSASFISGILAEIIRDINNV